MAERNERPVFEGKNRRVEDRRTTERRKFERNFNLFKYFAVIAFLVAFVVIYSM
jgi:hypothetical protein